MTSSLSRHGNAVASSTSSIRKCDILGGPITAVSGGDGGFYAGQGPYLRTYSTRVPLKEESSDKASLLVFPEGGVIHGIRPVPLEKDTTTTAGTTERLLLLLFGGRRIAFVCHDRVCRVTVARGNDMKPLPQQPSSSSCIDFPDWIWQVLCLEKGRVVVGLAHAAMEICAVSRSCSEVPPQVSFQRMQRIRNPQIRSISYCLDIWAASSTTLWMAHGNATNEICLWSATTTNDAATSDVSNALPLVLRGHVGVLHAVRFHHSSGRYLASTSDDRTVRLWELQQSNQDWVLKWTAYGHTARGWDVAFCPFTDAEVVLSTGEDGTLRIWDMEQGAALAVLRGHSCQCIWRVACLNDGRVITGGNNGTVALYHLRDAIPSTWFQRKSEKSDTCASPCIPEYGRWHATVSIPTDAHQKEMTSNVENAAVEFNADGTCPSPPRSRPKKSKKDHQVIVGMKLAHHPIAGWPMDLLSSSDQAGPHLIVATRAGSVWYFHVPSDKWTALEPWRRSDTTMDTSLGDGCCLAVHPQIPVAAIGTVKGDIVLFALRHPSSDATNDGKALSPVILSSAREHRSVQNIKWVEPHILASFHVKSIVWWTFPNLKHEAESDFIDVSDGVACFNNFTKRILFTETKGLAICSAWDAALSRLVVGDTRGNLVLFNLIDPSSVVVPTSVLHGCHQKEHITDVLWKNENTIVSVGNDGRIVYSSVDHRGCITKQLAVPVMPFTGISMIWSISSPLSSQLIVGGYYGNHFAVVDVMSGYEFFRIDTGGRQRIIDVGRHDSAPFPKSWIVATCINRPAGQNDIEIHGLNRDRCDSAVPQSFASPHSFGIPLHGESIFDLDMFPIAASGRTMAILTGSEDCSARITLYRDDRLLHSVLLPPQVSGIRAVRSCRYNTTSTIVVLGGKSVVDLYLVPNIPDSDDDVNDLNVCFLGSGSPVEKVLIDQRINCIGCKAIWSEANEHAVVVLSGDSNGSCYFYCFSQQFAASGRLFYQDCRPILSLEILQLRDSLFMALGETSGDVVLLTLNHRTVCNKILEHPQSPLMRYKAHSMGTNSLALCLLDKSQDGHDVVRIGSCGDDQAVSCTDIELKTDGAGEISCANVLRTFKFQNAALSALKGIEFLSKDLFVVTGYDQRLSSWRLSSGFDWIKLDDAPINVGDVNCLAACHVRDSQYVITVGGAGVEMLAINTLTDNS